MCYLTNIFFIQRLYSEYLDLFLVYSISFSSWSNYSFVDIFTIKIEEKLWGEKNQQTNVFDFFIFCWTFKQISISNERSALSRSKIIARLLFNNLCEYNRLKHDFKW